MYIAYAVFESVEVNAVDNLHWSPLHFACDRGQVDVAGRLLDAGAKLKVQSVSGATPLVEAVRSARPKMVQLLISRGASTNCTTRNGCWPIY